VVNGKCADSPQQPGTSYQWYFNSKLVEGGSVDPLKFRGMDYTSCNFQPLTCNRISDPIVDLRVSPDQEVELSRLEFL